MGQLKKEMNIKLIFPYHQPGSLANSVPTCDVYHLSTSQPRHGIAPASTWSALSDRGLWLGQEVCVRQCSDSMIFSLLLSRCTFISLAAPVHLTSCRILRNLIIKRPGWMNDSEGCVCDSCCHNQSAVKISSQRDRVFAGWFLIVHHINKLGGDCGAIVSWASREQI